MGNISTRGRPASRPITIYVHASVKDAFLEEVKKQICAQYGPAPLKDASYGRIVSRKHFDRVSSLIETEKVIYGGGEGTRRR
ncbi:MAG: hypothetical protein ACLRSW_12140 [Christensenellaceae bacterium]